MKYDYNGFAASSVTNSGGFLNLFNPPIAISGGSINTRIGDVCHLHTARLRFQAVGGDIYNTMRVIVFRWKSNGATAPTTADLFDVSATGAEYVMCPTPSCDRQQKVDILYDKVVTLTQSNASASSGSTGSGILNTSSSVKTWSKTLFGKKLGPKLVRFQSGTATIPNGGLWLAYISDSAITPNPTLYVNCRVDFTNA